MCLQKQSRLGLCFKCTVIESKYEYLRNSVSPHTSHDLSPAITIVKTGSHRVERVIQGFAMNVDNSTPMLSGIQYDPRTRSVVVNGKTGHIQFYDIQNNKQLYHVSTLLKVYCNFIVHLSYTETSFAFRSMISSWLLTL